MKQRTWPRSATACSLLATAPLAGCATHGAPSFALFGAYFPFWLTSAIAGVVGALVAHRVFVKTGWARAVPYQLSVCTALGVIVGVIVWLLGTGAL
ncbi:YtcA family lipoprotein [Paraburkholderia bannensis]|uniref:YtcA family lipoprotein n=1 Tax=Paraburkholderia bannensis TaxID=765414 RepID=UPI002AB727D7|nr:YtcA family lipoprotein [Paraburkholderia bannensis]